MSNVYFVSLYAQNDVYLIWFVYLHRRMLEQSIANHTSVRHQQASMNNTQNYEVQVISNNITYT